MMFNSTSSYFEINFFRFILCFRFENQHNHYHYHHHPHQSIGSSTEQLVLPHQHNGNVSYHQSPLQLGSPKSEAPREILSVSGKKKCSYCCEELGKSCPLITVVRTANIHLMFFVSLFSFGA